MLFHHLLSFFLKEEHRENIPIIGDKTTKKIHRIGDCAVISVLLTLHPKFK